MILYSNVKNYYPLLQNLIFMSTVWLLREENNFVLPITQWIGIFFEWWWLITFYWVFRGHLSLIKSLEPISRKFKFWIYFCNNQFFKFFIEKIEKKKNWLDLNTDISAKPWYWLSQLSLYYEYVREKKTEKFIKKCVSHHKICILENWWKMFWCVGWHQPQN